ncbi:PucR family transcriptional regulator [Streptomyces sp. ODS28]|uniref:PucR family transcriptional regulator n=1 Tax=Streptomyces sp. ODS28 TaxID=3136688 RepID=UPI0031E52BCC
MSPDVLALPTLGDILALPGLRAGKPRVLTGHGSLDRAVRWVHVSEIADIAGLLSGGELVLTTGIALPEGPRELDAYVRALAEVGAAGIVLELVRRWPEGPPPALVRAAEAHGLPLVVLGEEIRFAEATEAVSGLIRDAQLAELRAAEQIHEVFTELTVAGAGHAEVLREVVRTAGLPVVLETLGHDVLAYDAAGGSPGRLLEDWRNRSRAVRIPDGSRTGWDAEHGALVTVVGARGDDWGRLVLLSSAPPAHRHVVTAERAASALAVGRLVSRDRDTLERQAHRTLLTELGARGEFGRPGGDAATGGAGSVAPDPEDRARHPELTARAAALGVDLERGALVGLAVRPCTGVSGAPALATQQLLRDLAEATTEATRRAGHPALVAALDDTTVQALVTLDPGTEPGPVCDALADGVRHAAAAGLGGGQGDGPPVVVACGSAASSPAAARRTLAEAVQVAEATASSPAAASAAAGGPPLKGCARLADTRLTGLLLLLRDDPRLSAFVQRELAPLLEHPDGPRLLELLRVHCASGGNKSAGAAAAHLSRTAYYDRLARLERLLGVALDDPRSLLSLHVALTAHELAFGGVGGPEAESRHP